MFKILTLNNISKSGLARFPAQGYQVGGDVTDPDALIVRSADLHSFQIPASLKAVGRAGAGVNNVPVAAMSARGIPVFNAPGANANAVKELVVAGMLMAARNLGDALAFSEGLASSADPESAMEKEKARFAGSELAGRSLGVVGLGAIGVKVANAGRALGMKVIGFDPHMTVDGAWQLSSDVAKASSLNEILAAADYVSFHVPLVAETRNLFSLAEVNQVRHGVVLLNFARDGIVDAAAIRAGLDSGRIARYVSDFPGPGYFGHPRVIAFPHLGASTAEAESNCAVMVVDHVRDFLEHGHVAYSVNFPSIRMSRAGSARVALSNRNVPNMIGQISQAFGQAGINIAQMHNGSRGDLAYNLVDIEAAPEPGVLDALRAIDGVLAVRVM